MLEEMGKRHGATWGRFFISLVPEGQERWAKLQMTMKFSAGENTPKDFILATEELYRDIAEELILAMQQVKSGETAQVKAAKQAVRDLRDAFQMIMDERTRVDKLRKELAGAVRDHAHDFDTARDEVGRRLARLRDARSGG